MAWNRQQLRRPFKVLLALIVVLGPYVLFYRPYDRIPIDPILNYRLQSDDFAYIAASRTLPRAISNLFVPHNAHIVPTWRMTTWCLVAMSGRLSKVPFVLGFATYAVLAVLMLSTGLFVSRETKREALGWASACFVATTSIQYTAGTWYSAGQPIWAGLGILLTLFCAQNFKNTGKRRWLAAAAASTWIAGGFWTIGHASGPAAAVYLFADSALKIRKLAWVPLLSSILAVGLFFGLGRKAFDVTVSTNGRTTLEAVKPVMGLWHTVRAIPENLVFGNLGQDVFVDAWPGLVLTSLLLLSWAWSRRAKGRITPLEASGFVIMSLSYFVELSFRGYSPYSSIRGWVPWYEAVPHLGLVLWLAGWASAVSAPLEKTPRQKLTVAGALTIVALEIALLLMHTPRTDRLFVKSLPAMNEAERLRLPVLSLQRLRAGYLLAECTSAQHKHLIRYEEAERLAAKLGIGLDSIKEVFGWVAMPELPKAYNAADMLDLPPNGRKVDAQTIKRELEPWLEYQPEPRHLPDATLEAMPIHR